MAFNPFSFFRRFSKVGMAFLAIMCMLLFVLSGSGFSGSDPLDALMGWLQIQGRRTVAAQLNGSNIYDSDFETVRKQRAMADAFLQLNLDATRETLQSENDTLLAKPDNKIMRISIDALMQKRRDALIGYSFSGMAQPQEIPLPQRLAILQQITAQVQVMITDKDDDRNVVLGNLQKLLRTDPLKIRLSLLPGFFGGEATNEGLLEFMVWLKEADKLGIRFTPEDISAMVRAEVYRDPSDTLPKEKADNISKVMSEKFSNLTPASLTEALANEFRVRAAKVALTGSWDGMTPRTATATPVALSPELFWQDYRDQRTSMELDVVSVKAESFMEEANKLPVDTAAVKALYEQHKGHEPNPGSSTPGFMEPRLVTVQWVDLSGDASPYYQAKASEEALGNRMKMVAGSLGGLGVQGGGFIAPAVAAVTPIVASDFNTKQYDEYNDRMTQRLPWTTDRSALGFATDSKGNLAETSLLARDVANRKSYPSPLAGFAAQLVGQVGTGVPGHLASVSLPGHVLGRDNFDRQHVRATWFLTLGGMDAGTPLVLTGLPLASVPQTLPYHQVAGLLSDGSDVTKRAADLQREDVTKFLDELKKRAGKAGTHEYVAGWLAERKFKTGTTKPQSVHTLKDDPNMAALVAEYGVSREGLSDPLKQRFGYLFMGDSKGPKKWEPADFPRMDPRFGTSGMSRFLFWRTEDTGKPTAVPEAEGMKRAEAAWRLQKAREMAEKKAKELEPLVATEVKKGLKELKDLAAANNASVVTLNGVAKLVERNDRSDPNPLRMGPRPTMYSDWQLPEEVDRTYPFPYPSSDFQLNLLKFREQEEGATKLLPDRPKTTYYIAALRKKNVPTVKEFADVWARSVPGSPDQDTLREWLIGDRVRKYSGDIQEQLSREMKARLDAKTPPRGGEPTERE